MSGLRSQQRRDLLRTWRWGLVIGIAVLYAWIGLSAHGLDRVLGLTGAILIVGALAVAGRSRPTAVTLLLLGALPLAVTTWWSLATPLLAALAIVLAWPRAVTKNDMTPPRKADSRVSSA